MAMGHISSSLSRLRWRIFHRSTLTFRVRLPARTVVSMVEMMVVVFYWRFVLAINVKYDVVGTTISVFEFLLSHCENFLLWPPALRRRKQ